MKRHLAVTNLFDSGLTTTRTITVFDFLTGHPPCTVENSTFKSCLCCRAYRTLFGRLM